MFQVDDRDTPKPATVPVHLDLSRHAALLERAIAIHRAAAWAVIVEGARAHEDDVGTLASFAGAQLVDLGDVFVVLALDGGQLAAGLDRDDRRRHLEDILAAAARRPVEVIVANARTMVAAS